MYNTPESVAVDHAEHVLFSVDTWIGMAFVVGGIALCVQSKNT